MLVISPLPRRFTDCLNSYGSSSDLICLPHAVSTLKICLAVKIENSRILMTRPLSTIFLKITAVVSPYEIFFISSVKAWNKILSILSGESKGPGQAFINLCSMPLSLWSFVSRMLTLHFFKKSHIWIQVLLMSLLCANNNLVALLSNVSFSYSFNS